PVVEVPEARHHVMLRPAARLRRGAAHAARQLDAQRVCGGKRLDQPCRNRLHRSRTPVSSIPFLAKRPAPAGGTESSNPASSSEESGANRGGGGPADRPGDRWHLDEMVVRIAGKRMY